MESPIVLDTHALIWWSAIPGELSPTARETIDSAPQLLCPSICFWETSLLVRKGRLILPDARSVSDWMRAVTALPRVRVVPLDAVVAVAADALVMHADPADRFIVATALAADAALVTRDQLLQDLPFVTTVW